jgi:hypothetical protein
VLQPNTIRMRHAMSSKPCSRSHALHVALALASDSLKVLRTTARDRRNVFEQLIEAVKCNSLG